MQAIIEKMELTNFKGCRNATYEFGKKSNSILGQNGAGKSTIAAAWYWVFANCDTDLHNNPEIFPLGVEECTPTARIWLNCGEKSVEVAKMQKRTVKKSKTGGTDTISLSNSYEVNNVEYGERDFKKKMAEYGFDFDLFLPLSHPDVFTSQKSADMRKVLFVMASEQSDFDIALQTDDCIEATNLLKMYTFDEVKAMQNATLRKIREEYGKDGEILRAKIEGMEQSKTDIDVAKLELQKNALNEQIAENKAKQEDISKEFEERKKASDGILELQFELNDLQRKANEENNKKRREIEDKISDKKFLVRQTEKTINDTESLIEQTRRIIEEFTNTLQTVRDKWKTENERVFDENSLVCSYCGQEYPPEKKEHLREEFESHKTNELNIITGNGNMVKSKLDKEKETLERLNKELPEHKESLEMLNNAVSDLEKQLSELPDSIDISDRPEVQEIQRQIAEKEQAMNKGNSAEEIRQQLKADGEDLQSQLTEVEKQIALAQKNVEIDEQIADLRKKQGEYEQNKADCEKILYQLDLVSRKKNELLTEDINKNFDIVKWQMFEYQKNGDYKDCCIPMIDGKRFGESTNTGREVLAKLDIIKGLQRFYGQSYPVFLDGAECLSDETVKRIEMDCQLILLKVSEDKELKIEMEDCQ